MTGHVDSWEKLDRHHKAKTGVDEYIKGLRPKQVGSYEDGGHRVRVFEAREGSAPYAPAGVTWA